MMIIKGIIEEDTINYKKICMTIEFPYCSFKCDKECGQPVCQNSALANSPEIRINSKDIVDRYINNPITSAIVYQGLEPFDSYIDLMELTEAFRQVTDDDIVIYTGYTKNEIGDKVEALKKYIDACIVKNIKQVRIIHGFGSGVLRKMTHEYLSTLKGVKYRLGDIHEGGGGATVVILP